MEEEKTWPQLLRTVGPSEEDVRNAAEAGAKRFEAHKASFLEKITEEVSNQEFALFCPWWNANCERHRLHTSIC